MSLLPFDELPAHSDRKFVPRNADLGNWSEIEPLFDQLQKRVEQTRTASELEEWVRDWSEISAALDEESSRRYIAMTCHTDNADAEKAYLHFVEVIEPALKPRQFKLEQLDLQNPDRSSLPGRHQAGHDRLVRPDPPRGLRCHRGRVGGGHHG